MRILWYSLMDNPEPTCLVYDKLDPSDIPHLSRFFRINPHNPISREELEREISPHPLIEVDWMPGFFKLPINFKLKPLPCYQEGKIYGMDVSSAAVVIALDLKPNDHVLDFCCAPGAKLSLIADILHSFSKQKSANNTSDLETQVGLGVADEGSVTGVDVSKPRLSSCKKLCNKYQLKNVRLFLQDATTFDVLAPRICNPNQWKDTTLSINDTDHNETKTEDKHNNEHSVNAHIMKMREEKKLKKSIVEVEQQRANVVVDAVDSVEQVFNEQVPNEQVSNETIVHHDRIDDKKETDHDPKSQSNDPNDSPTTTTTTKTESEETTTMEITTTHTEEEKTNKKRKRQSHSKKKRRKKKYKNDLPNLYFSNHWQLRISSVDLYDKVVVDAHCTLDASVRHIIHYNKLGWKEDSYSPLVDKEIIELQKKLIVNGFRLLKPGGNLVYSTCSFCRSQNEDVVQYLLDHHHDAKIVQVDTLNCSFECNASSSSSNNQKGLVPAFQGSLPHTLRFYPKHTGSSGMFIAKITKLTTNETHSTDPPTTTSTSSTSSTT
eukprot:TRINITY_DN1115_c1_g2_i1.p1 TRINITY_DN1115_c1_g2~~TRINITY_DN1115_c1_g2_i1.p1  ORF type:complete len:548 (-),score=110.72 TRINITY_DN1115_c1_g2_i1:2829-4472(-)